MSLSFFPTRPPRKNAIPIHPVNFPFPPLYIPHKEPRRWKKKFSHTHICTSLKADISLRKFCNCHVELPVPACANLIPASIHTRMSENPPLRVYVEHLYIPAPSMNFFGRPTWMGFHLQEGMNRWKRWIELKWQKTMWIIIARAIISYPLWIISPF